MPSAAVAKTSLLRDSSSFPEWVIGHEKVVKQKLEQKSGMILSGYQISTWLLCLAKQKQERALSTNQAAGSASASSDSVTSAAVSSSNLNTGNVNKTLTATKKRKIAKNSEIDGSEVTGTQIMAQSGPTASSNTFDRFYLPSEIRSNICKFLGNANNQGAKSKIAYGVEIVSASQIRAKSEKKQNDVIHEAVKESLREIFSKCAIAANAGNTSVRISIHPGQKTLSPLLNLIASAKFETTSSDLNKKFEDVITNVMQDSGYQVDDFDFDKYGLELSVKW